MRQEAARRHKEAEEARLKMMQENAREYTLYCLVSDENGINLKRAVYKRFYARERVPTRVHEDSPHHFLGEGRRRRGRLLFDLKRKDRSCTPPPNPILSMQPSKVKAKAPASCVAAVVHSAPNGTAMGE